MEEDEIEAVREYEHPQQNALVIPSSFWMDEGFDKIPEPEDWDAEIEKHERFIRLYHLSFEKVDGYSSI